MYKFMIEDDRIRAIDESAANIKSRLQTRLVELEEQRDAINDRYPHEDLLFQWEKVDCEEDLIQRLLAHLGECAQKMKNDK